MTDQVPTLADLYQAKRDVKDINTFTHSPETTFVDGDGVTKLTLTGVLAQIRFDFKDPLTFTTGATLNSNIECLRRESDGEYFRWAGPVPPGGKVVAPGTNPLSDPLYVAVGSASLAANLNAGTALIAGVPSSRLAKTVIQSDNIKSLPVSGHLLVSGQQFMVSSFYPGWAVYRDLQSGGRLMVWDSTRTKIDHNGGTVIAPEAITEWDGSHTGLSSLLKWTGSGTGCYVMVGTIISLSVNIFGASVNLTDNRLPIQFTINEANKLKIPCHLPGNDLFYMVNGSLWLPSNSKFKGDGGRSKLSKIKRADGSFTDLFLSGIHQEGVENTVPPRVLKYRNGMPYTQSNIGRDIEITGVYVDGNGLNSGFAPELGMLTDYRGSSIFFQYLDGVTISDVFCEYAPNDNCQVSNSRRISITKSEFSRNKLLNFAGMMTTSTRNCLTVSGTLNGVGGFDSSDFIIVRDIISEDSEDLGVAIQFASSVSTKSGGCQISNITTKGSATYGTAIEISGSGSDQPFRENIQISQIISEGDSVLNLGAFAGVSISNKSRNITLSDIIVKDSGSNGIVINGTATVAVNNIIVDGYNLNNLQNIKGLFSFVTAPDVAVLFQGSNVQIHGGANRGGDTYGCSLTGYENIQLTTLYVDGTSHLSINDSAAIFLSAKNIQVSTSKVENSATNGWRILGFMNLDLNSCVARNSGKGSGQKSGFNISAGTNRRGRLIGCSSFDDQTVPTQTIGYLLGTSTTDTLTVMACDAYGNISGPLVNTGMPNARVFGNSFDSPGSSLPFNIGGNGNYKTGLKLGNYHLWVEQATGKLRIKNSTPTSDNDGVIVGTQT